jgi:hypothetical protein
MNEVLYHPVPITELDLLQLNRERKVCFTQYPTHINYLLASLGRSHQMATQGLEARSRAGGRPIFPLFFFVCFYSLVHITLRCKYCISPSACNTLGYTRNPRCTQFQKKKNTFRVQVSSFL